MESPRSITSTSTASLEKSSEPPSKKRFQLKCRRLFLTFPQCSVTKELALERLISKYQGELTWYIIAEEQHADGTPHLHLALEFKKEFSTRKQDVFDFIGDKHGNYQSMKNQRKCVEYVTKHGVYLSHGIDVSAIRNKKKSLSAHVAKALMDGKSLEEIVNEDPGFFMMHKRKIEDFQQYVQSRNNKRTRLPWVPFLDADIADMDALSDREIALWLNQNIRQKRPLKTKSLYIWGPPNMGKSSLIQSLGRFLSIYVIPRDEEFYDEYEDGLYDLAVLDEAKSTKTMQWLNQWLDGQVMCLRKKGKQYTKTQNIPTIILSNYSLEQNYKKLYERNELGPLITRLMFVEVKSFISVWPSASDEEAEGPLIEKEKEKDQQNDLPSPNILLEIN